MRPLKQVEELLRTARLLHQALATLEKDGRVTQDMDWEEIRQVADLACWSFGFHLTTGESYRLMNVVTDAAALIDQVCS